MDLQVTLSVSSGVLAIEALGEGDKEGQGEKEITVQSTSLSDLNNLLGRITYTSTVYRMRTGDLGKAIDPAFLPYPCLPLHMI